MSFEVGIVGLPNVGKSTIFNVLSGMSVPTSNYPFCTIEPNVAVVAVPDNRLDVIAGKIKPKEALGTTIKYFDIAGLVEGSSKGEGLGNKFLAEIRNVDAVLHVVRCFDSGEVSHATGEINPEKDVELIDAELMLADLETVSSSAEKIRKQAKSGDKDAKTRVTALDKTAESLSKAVPLRRICFDKEESAILGEYNLLTMKKVIYVANLAEENDKRNDEYIAMLEKKAEEDNSFVVRISARFECELSRMSGDEAEEFRKGSAWEENPADDLIRKTYKLLDLITFFTTANEKLRAWTLKSGQTAEEGAIKIHTDIAKGFIKAEVVNFTDLEKAGSLKEAKENGFVRAEGRHYVIKDGDIIYFHFS